MYSIKSDTVKAIVCILLGLATLNCFPLEEDDDESDDIYYTDINEDPEDGDDDLDDGRMKGEGIVGGSYVKIRQFPYMAQVIEFDDSICGAAIISKEWLVTAAHCVNEPELDMLRQVLLGTNFREDGGQLFGINQTIRHEKFDYNSIDNDIALIQIYGKIKFNGKRKALKISDTVPKVGDKIKVAGWGKQGEARGPSYELKAAFIPVVDPVACNADYKKYFKKRYDVPVTKNMFCAHDDKNDTCGGDSGGPAVVDGKLAGVISWALDCGDSKLPGVYTTVANYRDWIANHTGLKL